MLNLDMNKLKANIASNNANLTSPSAASLPNRRQLTLRIKLHNDKIDTLSIRSDLTVDFVKCEIEKRNQIPIANQELVLWDGTVMSDPLSLSDIAQLKQPSPQADGVYEITMKLIGTLPTVNHAANRSKGSPQDSC
jgi:hypothetical protein